MGTGGTTREQWEQIPHARPMPTPKNRGAGMTPNTPARTPKKEHIGDETDPARDLPNLAPADDLGRILADEERWIREAMEEIDAENRAITEEFAQMIDQECRDFAEMIEEMQEQDRQLFADLDAATGRERE